MKKARFKDDILTSKEVSRYLKIPLSSLHWLSRTKQIPAFKVGRHWRFKRERIEGWIKRQEGL